jgi:hypothetical protein
MTELQPRFPLSAGVLADLDDTEHAVLDQFATRFSKLQDAMGAKLFPAVLELTKEPGALAAFLDKLFALEKIGAIPSAERWLVLREMRNQFGHDYPEDPDIQCAFLNEAFSLAEELLSTLAHVEQFAGRYLPAINAETPASGNAPIAKSPP